MDKELIKLKRGETLQIEVEGKTIEIQQDSTPEQTDHTSKALGGFMEKVASILPELKGEKGGTGEKGDKGEDGKDGRDGKDGKDGENGKD